MKNKRPQGANTGKNRVQTQLPDIADVTAHGGVLCNKIRRFNVFLTVFTAGKYRIRRREAPLPRPKHMLSAARKAAFYAAKHGKPPPERPQNAVRMAASHAPAGLVWS